MAIIFQDGWESGDMSATSIDGFQWDSNNSTSVVTMNAACAPSNPNTSVAIWNNGAICNIAPGNSWEAKTGNNSLRFRYAAGRNWVEQRFDAVGAYPELWVGYWLRVPDNFYRSDPSGQSNNKFFDILMGPMSQYTNNNVSRIEMQTRPNGSGRENINIQFRNGTNGQFTNSGTYNNFLIPSDSSRWMHLVYHFKGSATSSSTDGILRLYRKWDGASSYEVINELVNLNVGITGTGSPGWRGGYIFGYANAPFSSNTEYLVDDFTFSTTSLLNGNGNGNGNGGIIKYPSGISVGESVGENVGEQ